MSSQHPTAHGRASTWCLLILIGLGLAGCDPPPSAHRDGPRAQFGQTISAAAVNALGAPVALTQFSGRFVWVDYAAEWCAACQPQSTTIRGLDQSAPNGVTFVTVMTSEPLGYGHAATQQTAARWAKRLSLDPQRVLAADLTNLQLPQHALFSPAGRELYRHKGKMSAAQIRAVLDRHGQSL